MPALDLPPLSELRARITQRRRARGRRHCITLPGCPDSPQRARRFVKTVLKRWQLDPEQVDDAELIASELVTNVVLHSPRRGCSVVVSCTRTPTAATVTVSVTDHGPRRPGQPVRQRPADADAETGRGLLLVAALADSWGHLPIGPGTCVYARLTARTDSHEPAAQ